MTFIRGFLVGGLLVGVAVGMAGPAAAEPLSGSYTETDTPVRPGGPEQVIFTPCGPDCTNWRYSDSQVGFDMHLHGNRWVSDHNQNFSFDKDSLQGSAIVPSPIPNTSGDSFTFVLSPNG
jgi:hypothetical protein